MLLTEKQIKEIIQKGIQRLTEGKLVSNISASEKVMDELSKRFYDMYHSGMPEHLMKKNMVYFLEQNYGVCERPETITKALSEIWDKIQLGAQKYGYKGPISVPPRYEAPDYIKEKAMKAAANEELMEWLGSCYYYAKKRGNLAWEMSPKNEYGMVNGLITYPQFRGVIGHTSFKEGKMIIKCLGKEIKQAAKLYAKKMETKEFVAEAVYNEVLRRLING